MKWIRTGSVLAFAFAFAFLLACFGSPLPLRAQTAPAAPTDIIVQHDVAMKTRDGVKLYACLLYTSPSPRDS